MTNNEARDKIAAVVGPGVNICVKSESWLYANNDRRTTTFEIYVDPPGRWLTCEARTLHSAVSQVLAQVPALFGTPADEPAEAVAEGGQQE